MMNPKRVQNHDQMNFQMKYKNAPASEYLKRGLRADKIGKILILLFVKSNGKSFSVQVGKINMTICRVHCYSSHNSIRLPRSPDWYRQIGTLHHICSSLRPVDFAIG